MEVWKKVPGFKGKYEFSSDCNLRVVEHKAHYKGKIIVRNGHDVSPFDKDGIRTFRMAPPNEEQCLLTHHVLHRLTFRKETRQEFFYNLNTHIDSLYYP